MRLTSTHTFATLEVSNAAYDEIAAKLKEAGYDHVFMEDGAIDMHGIGLVKVEAGDGIEPPQQPSKDCVLPLNEPAVMALPAGAAPASRR